MSITGSGVGGTIGGPPQPTTRELETIAANEIAKQMGGLVKDTLEVPFTQLGGNVWKYQSSANRPSLPPLTQNRVLVGYEPPPDDSWKSLAKDIVDHLPDDFKGRYLTQMSLPFEERDLLFVALDNLLNATAKALFLLNEAAEPVEPESPADIYSQINLALPYFALANLAKEGQFIFTEVQGFLDKMGANYIHYDQFSNYLRLIGNVNQDLTDVQNQIKEGGTMPSPEKLASLSRKIANLHGEFSHYEFGSDLQILGAQLEAMDRVGALLPFLGTGTASLLLSLNMALCGSETPSAAGFLGYGFCQAARGISDGLLAGTVQDPTIGSRDLLQKTITLAFAGAYGFAHYVAQEGFGIFPDREQTELHAARAFQYDLFLHMLASSGVLNAAFIGITSSLGAKEKTAELMAEILAAAALLLMTIPGSNSHDAEGTTKLLQSLKDHFTGSLDKAGNLVSEQLLNREIEDQKAAGLGIALQQARIALGKDDYEALASALVNVLGVLGITEEVFFESLHALKGFTDQMTSALTSASDDKTNTMTGIAQSA